MATRFLSNMHEAVFVPPTNVDEYVWRYTSIAKLIALLEDRALYFTPVSHLDDPFEGSFPVPDHPAARLRRMLGDTISGITYVAVRKLETDITTIARNTRDNVTVNCWHLSDVESLAMWNLYARDAIAIRTTYRRLCEAIRAPLEPRDDCPDGEARVGLVRYLDYSTDILGKYHFVAPYMAKRRSFAHEREVRAVIVDFQNIKTGSPGIMRSVNLPSLVESVFVAPSSPAWQRTTLERLLRRYALAVPVVQSSLDRDPVF